MIPKVMNFYWAGSRMSWLRYMTLYSFRRLNPTWEINLYTDEFRNKSNRPWQESFLEQDFFTYTGEDYGTPEALDRLEANRLLWTPKETFGLDMNTVSQSQRSNFFKWDILTNGCYYGDMDILFIKPMDEIYEQTKDHDAGISWHDYFSIGFLFGREGNRTYDTIYENACRTFFPFSYQGAGVETLYKKWRNLEDLMASLPGESIFNCPKWWFYFFDHLHLPQIFHEDHYGELPQDCYGLHWYAGSPISQAANNALSPATIATMRTTISKAILGIP